MNIKNVISFVAGAVVGGGICYYILGKRFDERLEREIRAMESTDEASIENDGVLEESYPSDVMEHYISQAEKYSTPDDEVDPANFESPSEEDTEEELVEDDDYIYDMEIKRQTESDSGKKPTIITSYSYWNEYEHFDKETLLYFVQDNQLTNENEEPIDDIPGTIGDALTKYDFVNSHERIIYVRNYSTSTDYEINKVFASLSS